MTTQRRVVQKRYHPDDEEDDPVRRFFDRKRSNHFHDAARQSNYSSGDCFMLPQLDRCR